jgi:hypothetical protein
LKQKKTTGFMRTRKTSLKYVAIFAAAASLISASALAQTIVYDNSSTPVAGGTGTGDNPVAGETTLELGDVVSLQGGATTLTDFSLEYYVNGTATVQAFLWAMDGPAGQPGTLLYSTLPLSTSGQNSLSPLQPNFRNDAHAVPGTIAWTLRFAGIDPGESAGLLFYQGPDIGSSPTFNGADYYYRHNTDGSWDVLTTGLVDNLGAQFVAVPEPSTWALLLGGFTTVGFMVRRRKA